MLDLPNGEASKGFSAPSGSIPKRRGTNHTSTPHGSPWLGCGLIQRRLYMTRARFYSRTKLLAVVPLSSVPACLRCRLLHLMVAVLLGVRLPMVKVIEDRASGPGKLTGDLCNGEAIFLKRVDHLLIVKRQRELSSLHRSSPKIVMYTSPFCLTVQLPQNAGNAVLMLYASPFRGVSDVRIFLRHSLTALLMALSSILGTVGTLWTVFL